MPLDSAQTGTSFPRLFGTTDKSPACGWMIERQIDRAIPMPPDSAYRFQCVQPIPYLSGSLGGFSYPKRIGAWVDAIAERVCKIGGTTIRSIGHVSRLQRVLDYVTPLDMLAKLRGRQSADIVSGRCTFSRGAAKIQSANLFSKIRILRASCREIFFPQRSSSRNMAWANNGH